MKNCTHCKHAVWQKTAAGRLHPSGAGKCGYEVKLPKLPPSMWWSGTISGAPRPRGGQINRRIDLPEHCVFFERGER